LNRIHSLVVTGILTASFLACKSQLQIESKPINLNGNLKQDSDLSEFILPYSVQMDAQMNVKIAESKNDFIVARPSSNLMNWMADAIFVNQTRKKAID
jgi:hypothetical protein